MSNTNSDGSSCKRRYLERNKSREIDSEEIEKQKEYCNTVVSDCDSCSYFLEQVSKLNKKEMIHTPNVEEEEEEVLPTPNVEKENMLVKIGKSISFSDNNTIIVAGILVSLISLVLLLCILAFSL